MARHVQNADSSVMERRLRPIYDWLDTGNNKKALQECDKVLKKSANLQSVKALKALTLLRMNRTSEANTILDSLSNEKPTDETTLQTMSFCYRECSQLEKICQLLDTALKQDPMNEEIHTHLFMSYVRINDFKAQQKTAMALYKQKPKKPYYCWNVMSIVFQATRGEGLDDPAKRKVLLDLAERMMKKLVVTDKVDAEQEIQLYILVLGLQEKYQEIIDLLNGPFGEILQHSTLVQLNLEYLTKLKKWNDLNYFCKTILVKSYDRWDVWKTYIHSVVQLILADMNGEAQTISIGDSDIVDYTVDKCHDFICILIEKGAEDNFLLRGPFLSRFELYKKLKEHNLKTDEIVGDLIELFIEYYRKFGNRQCCAPDLKIYLNLLSNEQKLELATKLVKEVGIGPTSVPQSASQMQGHITALQLARLCGAHRNLSSEHLQALVTAFTLHYQHGYQAYGKGLLSTDLGPSDQYALLAAHVLYDLSRIEDKVDYLLTAVALLESLLKNSPSNFHAKLLLIKFYYMLGDAVDANNVYYSLDIKHIQLDSLGYIHCNQLSSTGLFSLGPIHFDATLKFFSSNYKDSTDHLTHSYKFGSFNKIDEFMDFRERMNNSIHYKTVMTDKAILNLIECTNLESLSFTDISPIEESIDWNNIRDNRDYRVYVTWDPEFADKHIDDSEEIKRLFRQDLSYLKLRTHILWSLGSAFEVLKSLDGIREKHIENLQKHLRDWQVLEENVRNGEVEPISEALLVYPARSRLHSYLATPYWLCLSNFFEFFVHVSTTDSVADMQNARQRLEKELENLVEKLETRVSGGSSDFREKRKQLELFVNTLEVICIASVVSVMCSEVIKSSQRKKNRKRQSSESPQKNCLNLIVDQLKSQINKLDVLLSKWSSAVIENDLVNIFDALNLNTDGASLHQQIMLSYEMSQGQIQGALKNKLKLLIGL